MTGTGAGAPIADWDQLDWADLSHTNATISLHGRRFANDPAGWLSAAAILEEAVQWREGALKAAPA